MSANTGVIIGILCYFAVMILVGYLMKSKNKGAEDFLVGGRSFGMFFNTGTLVACWLGGAIILGFPGTLLSCGIWDSNAQWGVVVSIGGVSCLAVAGAFYMRRLWQLKLLSLGDFFYIRYGRDAGIISTILMCFTFTIWVAVQVIAFAKVGSSLMGLSLNLCVIISMAVICTYTILGGLWAVCLTDIMQVFIVIISVLILTPLAISMAGGWDAFINAVPKEKLNFFPEETLSLQAWLPWIGAWVIIGLGSVTSPDLMQRAFSAKTGRTARNSAFMACFIVAILFLIVALLSFASMQLMNAGLFDPSLINEDPELLIPVVVQKLMPLPLVVLFIGAVLAAVMSAAATANIALSGVIAKNLIKDVFVKDMSSRALMQTTRIVISVVGVLAAYISIALPSAFLLTSLGFDLILSCLFMPLTLGLYWKKTNGYGAIAGMLAGAVVRIIGSGLVNGFSLEGIGSPTDIWYVFTLGGPLASGIAIVVVSLLTQKRDRPIELNFEPDPS